MIWKSEKIGRRGIVATLARRALAVSHPPELQGRRGRRVDGFHRDSNIRDSPSVQLVVSLGKEARFGFQE